MALSNRNKLLRVNTITSLICQFVTLLCGFILPRLIIGHYGSAINGLIASITQFLGIITLCELGMGAVVPASLYKPLASKDVDEISKIVVSSEKFYRKVALGMFIYVIALTIIYPKIVQDYSFLFTSSLVLIIASGTFIQYLFSITYSLLITADQKQYLTYCLNAITIGLNLVVSFILIKLSCSIHVVKLVSSLIFICRPLFYIYYVNHHYQINKRIQYSGEPIKQKWNGVAQHIAYTVQEKAGVMVLTFMATLEDVSIYSIYFMIMEGIRGFIYSVTSSLTSFLGNIIANGEEDELLRKFNNIEWSIHNITILVFSSTAVLLIPFIKIYTYGIEDANYIVPVFPYIMCAMAAFRCLQMPYNIVVQAAGHFKQTQNSAIIEPIINIVLSVLFVHQYGLVGVAIGMSVSLCYRMVYLSLYVMKNILQISSDRFIKRMFVDALMVILIFLIGSQINIPTDNYVQWMMLAALVVFVAIVVVLFINVIFYNKQVKILFRK